MEKILIAAKDFGGANAIVPTISHLSGDYEIIALNSGALAKVLDERKIQVERRDIKGNTSEDLRGEMDRISPGLVLTGTSAQSDKLKEVIDQQIIVAARNRCPSVAVLDLWKNFVDRFSDKYSQDGKLAFMPDKIAVMDDLTIKVMTELGFPQEKLVATGNPAFDYLKNPQSYDSAKINEIRDSLGLRGKELVAWISQPMKAVQGRLYGDVNEQTGLRTLLSGIDSYRRAVVVRANPARENIQVLENIVKEFPNCLTSINTEIPFNDLIAASDVVATVDSTDFYTALCMRKPVISVQANGTDEVSKMMAVYTFKDYVPVVSSQNDVEMVIRNAKSLSLRNISGILPDGKAAERVAGLVRSLI